MNIILPISLLLVTLEMKKNEMNILIISIQFVYEPYRITIDFEYALSEVAILITAKVTIPVKSIKLTNDIKKTAILTVASHCNEKVFCNKLENPKVSEITKKKFKQMYVLINDWNDHSIKSFS